MQSRLPRSSRCSNRRDQSLFTRINSEIRNRNSILIVENKEKRPAFAAIEGGKEKTRLLPIQNTMLRELRGLPQFRAAFVSLFPLRAFGPVRWRLQVAQFRVVAQCRRKTGRQRSVTQLDQPPDKS